MAQQLNGSALKTEELLLLEILTYLKDEAPLRSLQHFRGKTVNELVESINIDGLDDYKDYGSYILGKDWANIIFAIRKYPCILSAVIADSYVDRDYGGGGGNAAVFMLTSGNEAVIAFRGTAPQEWPDDFEGGGVTDTLQQINALEWYRSVYRKFALKDRYITLTGHSKGGNKAKYIAIVDDTPDRCVSFDGQGFSDRFIDAYSQRILLRRGIIENHNVDFDYVSILLNDVGKCTYYYGYNYGKGGFAEAHCPNTFFCYGTDGTPAMRENPDGQQPEMKLADAFINSLARTLASEESLIDAMRLFGDLVEEGFRRKNAANEDGGYIAYILNTVSNPDACDLVASTLAFIIQYDKLKPGFLEAMSKVADHFGMTAAAGYVAATRSIINYPGLISALGVTDYLSGHIPGVLKRRLLAYLRLRYNTELSPEQLRQLLGLFSRIRLKMQSIVVNTDGADRLPAELPETDPETECQIDSNERLRVAVIAGGLSADRNFSLRSGHAVSGALRKHGHDVILIDSFLGCPDATAEMLTAPFEFSGELSLPEAVVVDMVPDLWAVRHRRQKQTEAVLGPNVLKILSAADVVFIALLNAYGEAGRIQAALDVAGIDYTGCGYLPCSLTVSKDLSKRLLQAAGIPTAQWTTITGTLSGVDVPQNVSFPVVVKPVFGGSGIGVGKAENEAELAKALSAALLWDKEVIVERYLPGREFSVCILGNTILPVVEVERHPDIYDYHRRYVTQHDRTVCPAKITEELEDILKKLAVEAGNCVNADQCYRVDFRLDENGMPNVLEIDLNPELTPDSAFAAGAGAAGIGFDALCEKVLRMKFE